MNCPIDNTPLAITERQGIEIDYCPKCRGVWLDRGELDKLIERSAQYETRRDENDDDANYRRSDRNEHEQGGYAPQPSAPNNRQGQHRQSSGSDIAGIVGDLLSKGLDKRRQSNQYDDRSKHKKKGGLLGELFDF